MNTDFTNFWSAYLKERDAYNDYAWENILRRRVADLPIDKQPIIIDILIEKCLKHEGEFYSWAFETFDELASEPQINRLKQFTSDCIKSDVPFEEYADLIVFFIKKDFEFIKAIVLEIISSQSFSNSWKYILKNVFFKDRSIFLTGIEHYLKSNTELGFDIGSFIKRTPHAKQFLVENIQNFKRFDTEFNRY